MAIPYEIGLDLRETLKHKPVNKEQLYGDLGLMLFTDEEIADWINTELKLERIQIIDDKFHYNYRFEVLNFKEEDAKLLVLQLLKEREETNRKLDKILQYMRDKQ